MAHPARTPDDNASIGELGSRISVQLSTLVRDELALARIELQDKGKRAGMGAGLLGGADRTNRAIAERPAMASAIAGAVVAVLVAVPMWRRSR